MVRAMWRICEQMSCLVKNQNQNVVPLHHKNLVFIRRAYDAPIVNNQITLLNFAQFYYKNHLNPYSALHQVGQAFLNPLNIDFNHTIVVLVRTNIPEENVG
jgi:hypothetical protein